jgi:hypothetical protein
VSTKTPPFTPSISDLLAKFADPPSALSLGSALTPGASALLGDAWGGYANLGVPQIKRKVYFAFRFKDIMRVNNVRQSGKIGFDEDRNPRDFYDRSMWEQRAISDPESLKKLMREGVEHSSVVCVLFGTDTWDSRWVKYEIARAVIDGRGLLAVGINGLAHHQRRTADVAGINPLLVMGVYQAPDGRYFLYENRWVCLSDFPPRYDWRWSPYADYTQSVSLPRYLAAPGRHAVRPLYEGARSYDYVINDGNRNLGGWLDIAAKQVGR